MKASLTHKPLIRICLDSQLLRHHHIFQPLI
jgi:hypothetical protein